MESDQNDFAGDPKYLFNADGSRSKYDQVSHFELIRSGYDQKLEIENFKLNLLFQAFDADGMIVDLELVDGRELEPAIARLFALPRAAYIHIHFAAPGCYAARVDRA